MNRQPLRVAVTGHRPNRLVVVEARLRHRICAVLAAIRAGAGRSGRSPLIALTALAEGADRMFADAALAIGYRVDVLIPFASTDYETTFADDADTRHYRRLVASAIHVETLPGSLSDDTAAYEAVGRACVDRCDILVAIWDGKPAAGRGGSPDIIDYALSRARPVVWIDAARDRRPMILTAPAASARPYPALERLARRARAAPRRAISQLAQVSRSLPASQA